MSRRRLLVIGLFVVAALAALGRFVLWPMRTPAESPTKFVPQPWEAARLAPMHAKHVGEKGVACTRCHEGDDFSVAPKLETCAAGDCHAKQAGTAHHGSDKAATTCLTCHVFRANGKAAACVDCHGTTATVAPRAHHGTPDATCTTCHDLHGERGARTKAADCTQCHEDVRAIHGRLEVGADAGTPPELGPHRTDGAKLCTSCHAPHAAKEQARTRCAECHVSPRTPSLIAALAAPEVAPRGKNVAGHEGCFTCHASHDVKKADAKPCVGCHQDRSAALEANAHTSCKQCHAPHAPAEARASCKGCHADRHVLASAKVPAHNDCTSCHDPHAPSASSDAVCAKCHASVEPKHPQGKACIGCHQPHPKSEKAAIAATCSSCHTKAKDDHAFHAKGVACEKCHRPHDFAIASARTGPLAVSVSGAFCAGCHAPEAQKVGTNTGHGVCIKCHGEPHTPNPRPACATCHRDEAATAPAGHASCNKCHDSHSGQRHAGTECATCHTEKRSALHGNLPQGCTSCHRAHGPSGTASPPACTSCHNTTKLPGLHAVTAHAQDCRQCHGGHKAPSSTRATCTTTCHTDRRGHQPEADVCKGCHMFR